MDDKAVIAVSSAQAVRDPVLVFRIGAGAQVREYTAILDPVGCSPKTKSALSDGKTHRKTAPKAESQENQNAKALRKTDKKDSANSAVKPAHNGKTHTVRKGETLKQIAAAIRPKHLTLEQVADALLKANPNVSAHGRLRAGSVLHIPNLNRIKAAAPKKIKAEQPKPQTAKPKAETASMPSEPSKQATVEKPIEKPVEKPVEKPEAKVAAPEAKAEKPSRSTRTQTRSVRNSGFGDRTPTRTCTRCKYCRIGNRCRIRPPRSRRFCHRHADRRNR